MAAIDLFESFCSNLSNSDREALKHLIRNCREDVFASRSEDARVRIVESFVKDAHYFLKVPTRL